MDTFGIVSREACQEINMPIHSSMNIISKLFDNSLLIKPLNGSQLKELGKNGITGGLDQISGFLWFRFYGSGLG